MGMSTEGITKVFLAETCMLLGWHSKKDHPGVAWRMNWRPISPEGVIPIIQLRKEEQKEVGYLYCTCVCDATLVMGEPLLGASF